MKMNTFLQIALFVIAILAIWKIFLSRLVNRVSQRDKADEIPGDCGEQRIIEQKEKGFLASYSGFKKGQLRVPNVLERLTAYTIMLTGTITALWEYCKEQYTDASFTVLSYPDASKTSFVIRIDAGGNAIFAKRVMKEPSSVGKNPMAAENPKNYVVEFGFRFMDDNSRKKILGFLDNYCSVNTLKCVERENLE